MAIQKKYSIDNVAFIGRTFDEYCSMFNLAPDYLIDKHVLDCPAGACSFTAELNRLGSDGVAADVLYGIEPDVLEDKCRKDVERAVTALQGVEDLYTWDYYRNIEGLKQKRIEAYQTFMQDYRADYQAGSGRYIHVELPHLPFVDKEFALVLSAHFLFLYGDRFDYDFHIQSLRELVRVAAQEVRIFPLLGFDAQLYVHLDRVIADLKSDGLHVQIAQVPFEFQKSGNKMLKITKT